MMKKVNYSEYEGKYDESIKERLEKDPESVDVEMMRENLYGYTFSKEYAKGEIPDEFSMDCWEEFAPQEKLILETIDSTGDGKTPETALCVIDVHQEYEYIQRVVRLSVLQLVRQSVMNGVDCLELKDYDGRIEKVYFDISRRFEVGY